MSWAPSPRAPKSFFRSFAVLEIPLISRWTKQTPQSDGRIQRLSPGDQDLGSSMTPVIGGKGWPSMILVVRLGMFQSRDKTALDSVVVRDD